MTDICLKHFLNVTVKDDVMTFNRYIFATAGLLGLWLAVHPHPTFGQSQSTDSANSAESAAQLASQPYQLTGRFHIQSGTNQGYLVLQCDLPPGNYINSLTQAGDLKPSTITVTPSDQFSTAGKFYPDQPPKITEMDPVFNQRTEKHRGKIQFFVPISVSENVDLNQLHPELIFDGQVCSEENVCTPLRNKSVKANFGGYFERASEKRDNSQNTRNN
jgi:hypothetical protein